jgi:hypothetical protein
MNSRELAGLRPFGFRRIPGLTSDLGQLGSCPAPLRRKRAQQTPGSPGRICSPREPPGNRNRERTRYKLQGLDKGQGAPKKKEEKKATYLPTFFEIF